ncbi:MAG: hypothetical protein ACHQIG_03570 [Acidimicrobiia bacterium]
MAGPSDDDARQWRTYAGVVVLALAVGIGFALHAPDRDATGDAAVAASATPTATVAAGAPQSTSTTRGAAGTTTAPKATTAPTTTTTTTVDPGSLPQTDAKPTASGPTFDAGVRALWQAIVRDDPDAGHAFFFPRAAYLQVKAISDPGGDYQNRLLANFADDVHTLHAKLGADAARAQFVRVDVPDQAVWVVPGQEYNQLPYWRVYGTTLHYSVDGVEQSFPVTSLISWRGEWYVVHLGAIR